jgi:hypothetical protein
MVVAGVVVALVAVAVLVLGRGDDSPGRESSGRALSRLAAGRPATALGDLGDVTRPDRLRRRLRDVLEADPGSFRPASARDGRDARECWRRQAPGRRGDRPLLVGRGRARGQPVTVLAVADRGRVVAFVVDPRDCAVLGAQSV